MAATLAPPTDRRPRADPAPPPGFSPPAAAPTYLDADSAGSLMTGAEFDAVEDADPDFRYQLIHGVVVVSRPPVRPHERLVDQFAYLLRKYQFEHPNGAALDETLPGRYVRTDPDTRRQPDRAVWCGLAREPDEETDVPAILIEIVSGSRRDRRRDYETKRAEYRAAGVREYWIVDRFTDPAPTLTVCFADGAEKTVGPDEPYETPLLTGFAFRPADVLRPARPAPGGAAPGGAAPGAGG